MDDVYGHKGLQKPEKETKLTIHGKNSFNTNKMPWIVVHSGSPFSKLMKTLQMSNPANIFLKKYQNRKARYFILPMARKILLLI